MFSKLFHVEFIEKLDKEGMGLIEQHDGGAFHKYLEETGNTVCGRHPIAVLLAAIEECAGDTPMKTRFVRYAQSGEVKKRSDSSVSYASSYTVLADA